ncbi:MAG: hypothetical protein WCC60_08670 [Ilumatobacteraceae bacterium]
MPEPDPADATLDEADLPFVLGGARRRRLDHRSILSLAMVAAVIALPLRGLFLATGSSMEEGFMLAFPQRILKGDIPNVDFLHLYGPFSLHVLSGWYWVFGDTLESQRVVGLLQHLGIIFALYTVARAWGRRTAVITAVTVTLLVLTPIGLSALAWEGGVALGLWSVAFGLRALHTSGRTRRNALLATGVLVGFALGYRPDLVLALGLVHGWLLWRGRSGHTWKPVAGGLAIGLVPFVVHLAMAGVGASVRGMFLQPVFDLRPGRELPRPPSFGHIDGALQAVAEGPADAPWWRVPALSANHQLFLWFFVVIIVAVAVPAFARSFSRRAGGVVGRHTVLLGASLFGLGMLPQALQRPDSTHLAWGSCVSFALLPCLFMELVPRLAPRLAHRSWLVAGAAIAALMLVVNPFFTYRYYLLQSRVSMGNKPGGFEVAHGGRRFYFGNQALQSSSQAVIDDLDRLSQPGDRLLVGPADLSRTIYSDAAFYYMFPELTPATFYIEMDPGLADKAGSRLAGDVASADWLILTNFWTGWYEPNASSTRGSEAPNQVVADHFCLVGNYEDALVLLYHKCAVGDGVSPAGIGIGAQRRADFERELAKRAASARPLQAPVDRQWRAAPSPS